MLSQLFENAGPLVTQLSKEEPFDSPEHMIARARELLSQMTPEEQIAGAVGGAGEESRAGGQLRRRRGRHGEVAGGVREVARQDAFGRRSLAGRHPASVLDAPARTARARGV